MGGTLTLEISAYRTQCYVVFASTRNRHTASVQARVPSHRERRIFSQTDAPRSRPPRLTPLPHVPRDVLIARPRRLLHAQLVLRAADAFEVARFGLAAALSA